jgi:DNA-directed RNA polymerase specialized sigma24 family protein
MEVGSEVPSWAEWEKRCGEGKLGSRPPGEIVSVCRKLVEPEHDRLRGKLLKHLQDVARGYLRPRVRRDLVNGGEDVIEAVVGKLTVALLTPAAADGVGFEKAFFKKLRQRLGDELRSSLKDKEIVEQEPVDLDTGAVIESPDQGQLSPEDLAIVADIIERLPPLQRKAFALHLKGFKYISSDPDESISTLLGKTPKTIQKWVEDTKVQIAEMLGAKT